MYFKFNVAVTNYPVKWNVYLLGMNETMFLRQLLLLRKPITLNPNKSLFAGTKKKCKGWVINFSTKSITEQLDYLEATYTNNAPKEETKNKNDTSQSKNLKIPKWRLNLQAKFRELLKAEKLDTHLHNEYKKIIISKDNNDTRNRATQWLSAVKNILDPKKKRKRQSKGAFKFNEISTPIGGQSGYKVKYRYH